VEETAKIIQHPVEFVKRRKAESRCHERRNSFD
jgi:hypothetical protein